MRPYFECLRHLVLLFQLLLTVESRCSLLPWSSYRMWCPVISTIVEGLGKASCVLQLLHRIIARFVS